MRIRHPRFIVIFTLFTILFAHNAVGQELPIYKALNDEMGVRYGIDIGVGKGDCTERQFVALDYARYSYQNFGVRVGYNHFFASQTSLQGGGFPLLFSWRSGRMKSSPQSLGHYHNGIYYPTPTHSNQPLGWALLSTVVSTVAPTPSYFELHTGVTPGWLCIRPEYPTSNGAKGAEFSLTVDLGGRMMLPIWRFRLILDVTYRYYLTNIFLDSITGQHPQRSFIAISGGVSFNF